MANAGDTRDLGSIPELGRSPGEGDGNLAQYYCLGNPMDREVWQAMVHGVVKSQTWMSDWTCTHARAHTHTHTHTRTHTPFLLSLIFLWRTVLIIWSPGSGPFYYFGQWLLSWSTRQMLFSFPHSSVSMWVGWFISLLVIWSAGYLGFWGGRQVSLQSTGSPATLPEWTAGLLAGQ